MCELQNCKFAVSNMLYVQVKSPYPMFFFQDEQKTL